MSSSSRRPRAAVEGPSLGALQVQARGWRAADSGMRDLVADLLAGGESWEAIAGALGLPVAVARDRFGVDELRGVDVVPLLDAMGDWRRAEARAWSVLEGYAGRLSVRVLADLTGLPHASVGRRLASARDGSGE